MNEAQQIITALRAAGWTVEQIATAAGGSIPSIYRWERGITAPREIYLDKLRALMHPTEEASA